MTNFSSSNNVIPVTVPRYPSSSSSTRFSSINTNLVLSQSDGGNKTPCVAFQHEGKNVVLPMNQIVPGVNQQVPGVEKNHPSALPQILNLNGTQNTMHPAFVQIPINPQNSGIKFPLTVQQIRFPNFNQNPVRLQSVNHQVVPTANNILPSVNIPFTDPRDKAVGESLLQLLQPSISTTAKLPPPRIDSYINQHPMSNPRGYFPLPRQNFPRIVALQLGKDGTVNQVNLPRMPTQVPVLNQYKPTAKTVTTPSYTNAPRMCPRKVPSAAVQPSQTFRTYSKFPQLLHIKANTNVNQSTPVIIRQEQRVYPSYTSEKSGQDANGISKLQQLLRSPLNKISHPNNELVEDPIGLLVPEVELVEDVDEEVTIPQWSPVREKRQKGDNSGNCGKKLEVGLNLLKMKQAKIILDRINPNVIQSGKVNLKRLAKSKLFLPRKKLKINRKVRSRKSVAESPEIVILDTPPKPEKPKVVAEVAAPVVDTANVTANKSQKMRCLVYKSYNFTHVIPIQDVISIPNELLEDLGEGSSPCQQLDKLLEQSNCKNNDNFTPEFEDLDLQSVSSVNLDREFVEKLALTYKSPDSTKSLKINQLRDKLMTALATNEMRRS